MTRAKPERDQNRNPVFQKIWWVIGHPRPQFRLVSQGLPRYIATVETAKQGPWKKRLPQILETLAVLGRASRDGAGAWRGGT